MTAAHRPHLRGWSRGSSSSPEEHFISTETQFRTQIEHASHRPAFSVSGTQHSLGNGSRTDTESIPTRQSGDGRKSHWPDIPPLAFRRTTRHQIKGHWRHPRTVTHRPLCSFTPARPPFSLRFFFCRRLCTLSFNEADDSDDVDDGALRRNGILDKIPRRYQNFNNHGREGLGGKGGGRPIWSAQPHQAPEAEDEGGPAGRVNTPGRGGGRRGGFCKLLRRRGKGRERGC